MEFKHVRMQIQQSSVTHELITPIRCISQLSKELISDVSSFPEGKRKSQLIYTTAKLVHA